MEMAQDASDRIINPGLEGPKRKGGLTPRKKIPPSEPMKQAAFKCLQGSLDREGHHLLNRFLKLASAYLLQLALEREVTEFLGRAHYRRGSRRRSGWRNGYEPKQVKTAQGVLTLAQPQVCDSEEPFSSSLTQALGRLSVHLEGCLVYLKFPQEHHKNIRTTRAGWRETLGSPMH